MSECIRVLHVIGMMDRGGAEAFIMNTYRNIDRSKIQFDFIVHTQKPCAYDNEIRALGGWVYNALPRYTGFNHFEYVHKWHEFFKKHQEYKLIHGHVRSTAAIYLYIAKQYGLTTIAHTHSTSSGSGISMLAREVLRYPIRYVADYMFACAECAGKWAYGSNSDFIVVKNAIDCESFKLNTLKRNSIRKTLNIEGYFVIGHVGQFRVEKNHEFLLKVFEKTLEREKQAKLLLVGDGGLKNDIEQLARTMDILDKIVFAGNVSNVNEYLQAMDVIVFPSIYEGLPVAIVESQAAGLPHVLSDSITDEIDMGMNLIEFISLNKPAEFWADRILSKKNFKRVTDIQNIVANGYDVQENARFLQAFYLQKQLESWCIRCAR